MPLRTFLLKGSLMLLIPLIDSIYLLLNHSNEHVYMLVTVFDKSIPFKPLFIVPYIAWFGLIFVALILFMSQDFKLYIFSIISIILGLLISFIIFSLFQTTVPRPEILGNNISSQLTRFIYTVDNPFNAFPSIHVLTSCIIFLGCQHTKGHFPKISLVLQGETILVILATLFLKQHTLLDVLGGLLLGGGLFKVVNWFEGVYYYASKKLVSKELKVNQDANEHILELNKV
ncbi:MAG: phosphatase PAP2 family protein [Desulfosporosinus sp.]